MDNQKVRSGRLQVSHLVHLHLCLKDSLEEAQSLQPATSPTVRGAEAVDVKLQVPLGDGLKCPQRLLPLTALLAGAGSGIEADDLTGVFLGQPNSSFFALTC